MWKVMFKPLTLLIKTKSLDKILYPFLLSKFHRGQDTRNLGKESLIIEDIWTDLITSWRPSIVCPFKRIQWHRTHHLKQGKIVNSIFYLNVPL